MTRPAAHTEGPWCVEIAHGIAYIMPLHGSSLATVGPVDLPSVREDAALMAAAPDFLALVEALAASAEDLPARNARKRLLALGNDARALLARTALASAKGGVS